MVVWLLVYKISGLFYGGSIFSRFQTILLLVADLMLPSFPLYKALHRSGFRTLPGLAHEIIRTIIFSRARRTYSRQPPPSRKKELKGPKANLPKQCPAHEHVAVGGAAVLVVVFSVVVVPGVPILFTSVSPSAARLFSNSTADAAFPRSVQSAKFLENILSSPRLGRAQTYRPDSSEMREITYTSHH